MLGLHIGLVLISGTTAWQLKSPLHATPARSHTRSLSSPRLATAGEDGEEVWSEVDELDASQTSDAWDDQVADFQRWKAQQAAEAAASIESNLPLALRFPDVDEEAHLDLGRDDEEDPNARMLRQLSEKQAQVMLDAMEGKAGSSADKRVLTSLEAIISTLSKLSDKVDKLSSKLDKLQLAGAAPAPSPSNPAAVPQAASADVPPSDLAAAPPAGTKPAASWDGEVDETAWFDEDADEDDLPDWRDVRRLNNLL